MPSSSWEDLTLEEKQQQKARLLRIRKTVFKMLADRGYMVAPEETDMNLDTFARDFFPADQYDNAKLVINVVKRDDPTEKMVVFFPQETPLGVKTIREMVQLIEARAESDAPATGGGGGHGIIVYKEKISGHAKGVLLELKLVELFEQSELLVNITEHILVPQHLPLSDEEKQSLLKRYRLKDTQLPRIQETDPVARYFGLKRGKVVKIVRNSETAGRYVTYRLVF